MTHQPDYPPTVDSDRIWESIRNEKAHIRLSLTMCVRCGLCAESCFLFVNRDRDPIYMPSHKVIHSLGRLYRKKGRVTPGELEEIREIVWERCVLCTRCYCPVGIDIPGMLALVRSICREQGVAHDFEQ